MHSMTALHVVISCVHPSIHPPVCRQSRRTSECKQLQLKTYCQPKHQPSLIYLNALYYAICADKRVTLTFRHVDLENSNGCERDSIKIYDGEDVSGSARMTMCGSTIPLPVTSFGSALTVQFVTSQFIQRTGFQAVYTESASGLTQSTAPCRLSNIRCVLFELVFALTTTSFC